MSSSICTFYIFTLPAQNNDCKVTLDCLSIHPYPSRQGGQVGLEIDHLELKEGGSKSENYSVMIASEGTVCEKHSDKTNNGKRSQNQKRKTKPKRRRFDIKRSSSSRSRCVIPEAKVIQGDNERAYISEQEQEEDEKEMEYLPRRVRRSGGAVQFEIPQSQPQDGAENCSLIKPVNGRGSGLHLRRSPSHGARCYCFNCW